jgi:hypothetical protein
MSLLVWGIAEVDIVSSVIPADPGVQPGERAGIHEHQSA